MTHDDTQAPDRHLYEVRYPDGHTVRLHAHRMQIGERSVCLLGEPGTAPGNIVFAAGLSSGITVTQPEHTVPTKPVTDGPESAPDLVRQDMINAYAEKWNTAPGYAEGMMQHVELLAVEKHAYDNG